MAGATVAVGAELVGEDGGLGLPVGAAEGLGLVVGAAVTGAAFVGAIVGATVGFGVAVTTGAVVVAAVTGAAFVGAVMDATVGFDVAVTTGAVVVAAVTGDAFAALAAGVAAAGLPDDCGVAGWSAVAERAAGCMVGPSVRVAAISSAKSARVHHRLPTIIRPPGCSGMAGGRS